MKVLRLALLASSLILLAAAASPYDLDVGSSARAIAMGGAGLALGDQTSTTAVLNPAAPAACGGGVRFLWPELSFHTTGASLGDLTDSLENLSGGDTDDAISLVNDFAKQTTSLSLTTSAGFAGPFGVIIEGEANGIITPGTDAREWANAAQLFNDSASIDLASLSTHITNTNFQAALTSANAYIASGGTTPADLTAAQTSLNAYMTDLSQNFVDADVVYGPTIMLSRGFERAGGTLYLGATGRILHSESRRWQITAASDPANPLTASGTTANPDINAGFIFNAVETPVQKDDSLAIDLGMIYKHKNSMWQYGAVVNNAIKPNLKGINNAQGDTSFSIGVAAVPIKGLIFAADLVNLTGANGENATLRFGGEMSLGSLFALRAGYSGQNWTYGFKVMGVNLAFQGKTAQLLTNAIKF